MGDVGDFLEDAGDFFSDVVGEIGDFGESIYKPIVGEKTSAQKRAEAMAAANARAASDAKIRQAEYERQAAMGRARAKAARRRGFASTILTGGGPNTLGGVYADSGKTLLGS